MKKLLLISILYVTTANAQGWVQTNCPLGSSTVKCFASAGTNIFAGSYGAGVFISTNNGLNWNAVNTGLTNLNVFALAISGTNIFAGTLGGGVFLSANNGSSWASVNAGLTNTNVSSLIISGTNIFAGTTGGVFLSSNNGGSWIAVNTGLTNLNIQSLVMSGANIFAGTYSSSSPCVFLSTNNGNSWTSVNTGLTSLTVETFAVNGINLFAGASDGSGNGGAFLSTNNGSSWSAVNNGLPSIPNLFVNSLAIGGTNIFSGTEYYGVFLSVNNGGNWTAENTGLTSLTVRTLAIIGTTIFAGTTNAASAGGVWIRNLLNFSTHSLVKVNCNGNNTGSITITPIGGTAPYQFSNDGGVTYQSSNIFNGLTAGIYPTIIKDVNNNVSTVQNDTITQPLALNINPTITNTGCGATNGQITALVTGGTLPYHYLWSDGDTINTTQTIGAGNYTLKVTDVNGCSDSTATLSVGFIKPNLLPLCLVTVDSLSTHNIVVWEKNGIAATIDSFRIYREVTTNVYSNIGSVSKDSLSEYHDYGANPNATSYKYKIAAIDSCLSISTMSDFHNTIHLQYLGNGNLQWTLYNIENTGNPVTYYIINRDDNNTSNFLPISSTIPGSNSTYTDLSYATYPNARYRIDVTWSISCNPSKSISTTHSNFVNQISTSVSQLENTNTISISPNPFTSQTTISFSEIQKNTTIKVMDLEGRIINDKLLIINGKTTTIDMSSYAKGVYFVQITTSAGSANEKVVNKKIVVQ